MTPLVVSAACAGYCVYRYVERRHKEKEFEVFKRSMEQYRDRLSQETESIKQKIALLDESKKRPISLSSFPKDPIEESSAKKSRLA